MSLQSKDRHDAIVASIIEEDHERWIEYGRAALMQEKQENPQEVTALQQRLVLAMEDRAEKQKQCAAILNKNLKLDPEVYPALFELFRNKRIATLFKDRPHMVGILKTRAASTSYNVGYTKLLNIYNTIADDPNAMLMGCEKICSSDDLEGILQEESAGALRECLADMEYLVDNHYDLICAWYFDYKTVPSKEDWNEVEEKRETRKRRKLDNGTSVEPLLE